MGNENFTLYACVNQHNGMRSEPVILCDRCAIPELVQDKYALSEYAQESKWCAICGMRPGCESSRMAQMVAKEIIEAKRETTDFVQCMKPCTKCGAVKVYSEFRFLNKQGRYHSHCRQCENAARKK